MPVCGLGFQSVQQSPLGAEVAAAAEHHADPAVAVDLFYSAFFLTPAQISAWGYFFVFFYENKGPGPLIHGTGETTKIKKQYPTPLNA